MNWKVATVFVLTIAALVVLYLYSFGPLSGTRKEATANPASVRPTGSEQITIPSQPASPPSLSGSTITSAGQPTASPGPTITTKNEIAFNVYHNKDKKENFYTIKFPGDWQIRSGGKPGSYAVAFTGGSGSVDLMDVPDNTTLELYLLSREEPRLKKSKWDTLASIIAKRRRADARLTNWFTKAKMAKQKIGRSRLTSGVPMRQSLSVS